MKQLIQKYQQGGQYYTVKAGNSPWQISHDFGIDLEEFYKMNPSARKMIHPGDKVMIKPASEQKVTYIPRQSVEFLKGVEVTAPKKRKKILKKQELKSQKQRPSNDSIKRQKITVGNISSNKQDSNLIDTIKSKVYQNADSLRKNTGAFLNGFLSEGDLKDDIVGVLNAPTITDSIDQIQNGIGRNWDKLMDKINDTFYPDDEKFNTTDSIKVPIEVQRKLGINAPFMSKQQLERYRQNIEDNMNVMSGMSYKPTQTSGYKTSLYRRPASDRYRMSENINLNDVGLGTRNRFKEYNNQGYPINSSVYNNTPINNTEGIIISSYNPFFEYGHPLLEKGKSYPNTSSVNNWNYYYGVDSNGNFIYGNDLSNFKEGDILTKSMAHDVVGVLTNAIPGHGITLQYANGRTSPMNMTSSTRAIDKIHRGREILIAGNEARLVSGSAEDLNNEIQSMKKRNRVNSVKLIELDNGSYSEGMRKYNNQLSSNDLNDYFNQNVNNGNFIYINNAIKKQAGPKQYQFNWTDLIKDKNTELQNLNWLNLQKQ